MILVEKWLEGRGTYHVTSMKESSEFDRSSAAVVQGCLKDPLTVCCE
jgi:hypothetical protein